MKDRSSAEASRSNDPGRSGDSSSSKAAALTPPAYGIAFADRRTRGGISVEENAAVHQLSEGRVDLHAIGASVERVPASDPRLRSVGARSYAQGRRALIGHDGDRGHELWHIAQQAMGRVHADARIAGRCLATSRVLEREAEQMSPRIAAARSGTSHGKSTPAPSHRADDSASAPIQRVGEGDEDEVPDNPGVELIAIGAVGQLAQQNLALVQQVFPRLSPALRQFLVFLARQRGQLLGLPTPILRNLVFGLALEPVENLRGAMLLPQLGLHRYLSGLAGATYHRVDQQLALEAPLVIGDRGNYTVHISNALIRAYREDLANTKSYMQESEGQLLALAMGVRATVYSQPRVGAKIVSQGIEYGNSGAQGVLLHVNRNHYIVLRPTNGPVYQYESTDGTHFVEAGETVSDGNCLIDGLHIIKTGRNASMDFFTLARQHTSRRLSSEVIENILTDYVNSLLRGEWVPGFGPRVWSLIEADPRVLPEFRRMQEAERLEKRKKSLALFEQQQGQRSAKESEFELNKVLESGSTRPRLVNDSLDGRQKVLKYGGAGGSGDLLHVQTEVLANHLYAAAGVPVIPTELVTVDNKPAQLAPYLDGAAEPTVEQLEASLDFRLNVAADFLFANWDMVKTNNFLLYEGRIIRSDVGGSLDRRAQGQVKEEWGKDGVPEIDSMRQSRKEDNNPYRQLTNEQIAQSIWQLLANLDEDAIDRAFVTARYPEKLRAGMKERILARMEYLRNWARKVYPSRSVKINHAHENETPSFRGKLLPKPSWERDPTPNMPYYYQELERLGYSGMRSPWELEMLDGFGPSERYELSRTLSAPTIPVHESRHRHSPLSRPSVVGPYELFSPKFDSRGSGAPTYRDTIHRDVVRMRSGRLLRRLSAKEMDVFTESALLDARSFQARNDKIFGKFRGEIVFSVNNLFTFEREKSSESSSEKGSANYAWVMEIPITDAMLQYFSDYAYPNLPGDGGEIPDQFIVNPQFKYEGDSGGRRDSGGIPNVVIRRNGFEAFWRTVNVINFIPDALYKGVGDAPLTKEQRLAQLREKHDKLRLEAEQRKKAKEKAPKPSKTDDDFDLSQWKF